MVPQGGPLHLERGLEATQRSKSEIRGRSWWPRAGGATAMARHELTDSVGQSDSDAT